MRLDRAPVSLIRSELQRTRRVYRETRDRRFIRASQGDDSPAQVELHFANNNPHAALYQVRQWYAPLLALNAQIPVAITVRSPSAARIILDECALPVFSLRNTRELEEHMLSRDPRVVMYVNHMANNFQVMRYGRALGVFISHGESEKIYMASGQLRAYDFAFVAGEAALARIEAVLPNYDVQSRTRQIGRPQLDFQPADRSASQPVTTVLYAPTYEGDRPQMAYGSVASHGLNIVESLIAAGFRIIYRPHPMTGTVSAAHRRADQAIRRRLRQAADVPAAPRHVVDTAGQLGDQLAESAVAIVDNSAMAFDWLVTGKPLIVTIPATEAQTGVHKSFLSGCYRIQSSDAGSAGSLVRSALAQDSLKQERSYWVQRHFGDTTAGVGTQRFIAATQELVAFGAAELQRRTEY